MRPVYLPAGTDSVVVAITDQRWFRLRLGCLSVGVPLYVFPRLERLGWYECDNLIRVWRAALELPPQRRRPCPQQDGAAGRLFTVASTR